MTTDTPGKAVWAGFTTEPVDAPRSPIQDALPDPPTPTPATITPAVRAATVEMRTAIERVKADSALVYDIDSERYKERLKTMFIGALFLSVPFVLLIGGPLLLRALTP